MRFFRNYFFILYFLIKLLSPVELCAGDSDIIIRDVETENLLRSFAAPLLVSAGLIENVKDANRLEVYILQSDNVNAFTFGGLTLVVTTGLLRTFSSEAVLGVIAHEIGHMANRHVALKGEALNNASHAGIASFILGLGAGILNPGLGAAILSGGMDVARKNFLTYSRSQESSADQAALSYLERSGYTAIGLKETFDYFEKHSFLPNNEKIEYFLTHPMPKNRRRAIETHLTGSSYTHHALPLKMRRAFERVACKIEAYEDPYFVLRSRKALDLSSDSEAPKYCYAVAYMRAGKYQEAKKILDALLQKKPHDPYYLELKAQITFEEGNFTEARRLYAQLLEFLPNETLIQIAFAHTLIESAKNRKDYQLAVELLQKANKKNPTSFSWRLMAIALGHLGDEGGAEYALAEEAVLKRDRNAATYHTARALKKLKQTSPYYQKAMDIEVFLKHF